ncbi:MAG: hypothetical protein ACREA0_14560, partial [bacterium]
MQRRSRLVGVFALPNVGLSTIKVGVDVSPERPDRRGRVLPSSYSTISATREHMPAVSSLARVLARLAVRDLIEKVDGPEEA